MELAHRTVENISIVSLSGRLVRDSVVQVREHLFDLIKEECPYLIVDLSQLHYVDAHGLSIFVSILKKAQRYGGDVVLLNPTDNVRLLIELMRLQHLFNIYVDESACVAYCIQQLPIDSKSHL